MDTIKKILEPLNIIYYELDMKKNIIYKDINYSNSTSYMEMNKITYHLIKNKIPFHVLKNGSIDLSVDKSFLKGTMSMLTENLKNLSQNIFILNDKKVKWAQNIPLFKIVPINKEIDLSVYDAIIFTSKNAINSINKVNSSWKKIPSYVISEQTAKLVKELNGNLEFVSKSKHGNEFAYELIELLRDKNVLYLRGKDIVSDLITILRDNKILCSDEIVYENCFNESIKKIKIPKKSKIIFTSPSTIKYFLSTFSWDDSYKAIAIGKTTAQYFPKNIVPVIADNTSFKACVDKALEI